MSATLAMKNVKVRAFGTKVTVPNNAMASLMYYLDCVSTVIDYKDRSLTDFQNYDELTGEELVAVYALAKIFHPSIFINAGIFIIMACNDYWLSKYYFSPIKQIDDLVRRIENENRVKEKPVHISEDFKSSPVTITCPFCKNTVTTETESKLNFVACICCLMFNILYC